MPFDANGKYVLPSSLKTKKNNTQAAPVAQKPTNTKSTYILPSARKAVTKVQEIPKQPAKQVVSPTLKQPSKQFGIQKTNDSSNLTNFITDFGKKIDSTPIKKESVLQSVRQPDIPKKINITSNDIGKGIERGKQLKQYQEKNKSTKSTFEKIVSPLNILNIVPQTTAAIIDPKRTVRQATGDVLQASNPFGKKNTEGEKFFAPLAKAVTNRFAPDKFAYQYDSYEKVPSDIKSKMIKLAKETLIEERWKKIVDDYTSKNKQSLTPENAVPLYKTIKQPTTLEIENAAKEMFMAKKGIESNRFADPFNVTEIVGDVATVALGKGAANLSRKVIGKGIETVKKPIANIAKGIDETLETVGSNPFKAVDSVPNTQNIKSVDNISVAPNIKPNPPIVPTNIKPTSTVPINQAPNIQENIPTQTVNQFSQSKPSTLDGIRTIKREVQPNNTILPQNDIPSINAPQQPINLKNSKFAQTVKNSPNTNQEVKNIINENPTKYAKVTNEGTLNAARQRIDNDLESAVEFVKQTKEASAEHTAIAIELINRFQREGNFSRAVDIADDISAKLTKQGQAIQAASMYDRLDPEGILLLAKKRINKHNENLGLFGKEKVLTDVDAENLYKLSSDLKDIKMKLNDTNLSPEIRLNLQLFAEEISQDLQGALQGLTGSTILKKIATTQTISQLLNPKTIIRNTVGNELFYRLERLNKYVSTPIDWARSGITGKARTVTFRTADQSGYWEGFLKGAKAGWKGTNPKGLGTQFDLRSPTFKGKYNPMTYLEKTLGATLKGFDYAAYNRAYNNTIGELAELSAINKGLKGQAKADEIKNFLNGATDEIKDIADQYGKYVTFQDDTMLSRGMQSIKRGLNLNQDFGLGDLILKYPKTPANLIMRAIDYSPAGFARAAYMVAKPIFKKGTINTREVTEAVSRAITGTAGLTGLGYFLADKGIITGQKDYDPKISSIENMQGTGNYKINIDALKRWVLSGFKSSEANTKEGDTMVSYDWAQPIAISLSMGANINKNIKEGKGIQNDALGVAASSLSGGIQTIAEQPVLQGVLRFFQGYNIADNVKNTLEKLPASFVPTFSNQIKQFMDNTGRNTYDKNTTQRILNSVIYKIPEVSNLLPKSYTTLGDERELYQNNSNTFFNVFLNPAFVTKYTERAGTKVTMDLYRSTSETTQLPRTAPKNVKFTYKGKEIAFDMTGEEQSQYQKLLGKLTNQFLEKFNQSPEVKNLADKDKVKAISNAITEANTITKYVITAQKAKRLQLNKNKK